MRRFIFPVVLGLLVGLGIGCKPPTPATSTEAPAAPAAPLSAEAEARQIFSGRCSPCHGATGAGDGAASAALTPHPANFREAAWQAGITDAQIEAVILQGGAAVGKSAAMPPNADLAGKPAVLTALRAMIRGMR